MEMEWVRGHTVGRGRFGTVSLAIPRIHSSSQFPPLMAVKSCHVSMSESLKIEKDVLSSLGDCPEIIRFFGDNVSSENGTQFYNLFLEYACSGTLADQLKYSAAAFEDSDVKRYTKSILKGLSHVHDKGFAHCDIKLQNILVFQGGVAKIADFGLAKRLAEEEESKYYLRGTPLYMSPELASGADGGTAADVWALGCAVVEMVSGKPAWDCSPECDVTALIYRIGLGMESPQIPCNMSSEGKDFLSKCFVRDPNERWTTRMLLEHPFISGFDDHPSVSPRSPFDLGDWEEPSTPDPIGSEFEYFEEGGSECELSGWVSGSGSGRLDELVVGEGVMPDWCDSDGWMTVR